MAFCVQIVHCRYLSIDGLRGWNVSQACLGTAHWHLYKDIMKVVQQTHLAAYLLHIKNKCATAKITGLTAALLLWCASEHPICCCSSCCRFKGTAKLLDKSLIGLAGQVAQGQPIWISSDLIYGLSHSLLGMLQRIQQL